MQLEVGWHRLLREKKIHASRPTSKPQFLPEVPPAMMCEVKGDTVPLRCDFFIVVIMYTVIWKGPVVVT